MKSKEEIVQRTKDGIWLCTVAVNALSIVFAFFAAVSLFSQHGGSDNWKGFLVCIAGLILLSVVRAIILGYIYSRSTYDMMTADLDTDKDSIPNS